MKKLCVILVTIIIVLTHTMAFAEKEQGHNLKRDTAAADIVIDVLLTRPIGFIGLITGTAAFILTLPVAIATESVDRTRYAFVEVPYDYTFHRSLGDVE
jgi:hypothetical protein